MKPAQTSVPPTSLAASRGFPAPIAESRSWFARLIPFLRVLQLFLLLYLFLTSIDMMGGAFKLFGSGFSESLIRGCSNRFVGLFIGILATGLVQSSSTITSLTVGFVGGGVLPLNLAIPILLGANVGTTLTNILVSFGFVTRKEDFRRAFAGATVHDFFNLCALVLIFPLELRFSLLQRMSEYLVGRIQHTPGMEFHNPLKQIIQPISHGVRDGLLALGLPTTGAGIVLLMVAIALLVLSLILLVKTLRKLVVHRVEHIINRYVFRNDFNALLLGLVLTILAQSSSVTTSLMVPMVAAGVISLKRCYPFTLGANLGTTFTCLLASLATLGGESGLIGLTAALVHLLFNLFGMAVFYPLRIIPLTMARRFADIAVESKRWAVVFVLGVFFVIPLIIILLT